MIPALGTKSISASIQMLSKPRHFSEIFTNFSSQLVTNNKKHATEISQNTLFFWESRLEKRTFFFCDSKKNSVSPPPESAHLRVRVRVPVPIGSLTPRFPSSSLAPRHPAAAIGIGRRMSCHRSNAGRWWFWGGEAIPKLYTNTAGCLEVIPPSFFKVGNANCRTKFRGPWFFLASYVKVDPGVSCSEV